ncbi:phage shock protein A [Hydrococcus rivularis NIES-593]|uniref:Phage shock protein A n=1 Tax=Hydrococcus rivularis NIES-593 TaxID=1921803 RepID=A0A1U7HDD8_9CYAN|nr:PspA/IM30 family protein [Hydrococcus rivularis]OKH21590.1 phage shock protein A [Hydrococcus rivularis NIES-593]
MGWLERMGRVLRAQMNSLVSEAEDPEKILEKAVMNMEQELIEMRRALAEAIATQKSTERYIANYQQASQKWYERAQIALEKGNEALAKEALLQRQSYQKQAQSLQAQLEGQNEVVGKLKKDLRTLEHKYTEAKAKKNLYIARLRSAMATQKIHEITSNLNSASSVSVLEQIETKILELEARSQLTSASVTDSLEEKFASLEDEDDVDNANSKHQIS